MLIVATTMGHLRFSELMEVYKESNTYNGKERYPEYSSFDQLREAEQDFYHYLHSTFFRQKDSFYAVWEVDGCYQSALRLEPYLDGFLLCALETAPGSRQQGYAAALISSIQKLLAEKGSGTVYSHISKKNASSLSVHQKCGFQIIKDYAVYADGSVLSSSYTMAYTY